MAKSEMEVMAPSRNGGGNSGKEDRYLGVAVHSQVKKIRQEMEKLKYPSLQQPEARPALREITYRHRSRSPLGIGERERERSISVGN